jgi:hypothetical protein
LQLKLPTPDTEKLFEASFNGALDIYRGMLTELAKSDLSLPNTNLDVGQELPPGKYWMADNARAKLLDELAKKNFQGITKEIRADLLTYFSAPGVPSNPKKQEKLWARVPAELEQLRQYQIPQDHSPTKAADHVPADGETTVSLR